MSKAYLALRNQIAQNVGRYNYDTEGVDNTTDRKILASFNEAQELVSRYGEPMSLETTISVYLDVGIYEYEFADFDLDDCNHIYSIKLNDGTKYYPPMKYVIPLTFDQRIAPYIHNATGKPEMFTIYNKTLAFSRLPDDDYQIDIRFRFEADKMVDTLSDCEIDEYEAVIVSLATAFTWLKFEEVEMYQEYRKLAAELFKPMKGDMRIEPTSRSTSYVGVTNTGYPSDFENNPFIKRVR